MKNLCNMGIDIFIPLEATFNESGGEDLQTLEPVLAVTDFPILYRIGLELSGDILQFFIVILAFLSEKSGYLRSVPMESNKEHCLLPQKYFLPSQNFQVNFFMSKDFKMTQ